MVLRVAAETGCRVSDVLGLTVEKLRTAEKNGGQVFVLESKTGKSRRVYINKELRKEMVQRINKFSPFVFPNRLDYTRPRTRQAVWKDLNRAAKALRVQGQLSPHSFRKYAAKDKFKKTGKIDEVQKWLRHTDKAVTSVYLLAEEVTIR